MERELVFAEQKLEKMENGQIEMTIKSHEIYSILEKDNIKLHKRIKDLTNEKNM